jgi:hypothetical protein
MGMNNAHNFNNRSANSSAYFLSNPIPYINSLVSLIVSPTEGSVIILCHFPAIRVPWPRRETPVPSKTSAQAFEDLCKSVLRHNMPIYSVINGFPSIFLTTSMASSLEWTILRSSLQDHFETSSPFRRHVFVI